jgi:hypothetical protein
LCEDDVGFRFGQLISLYLSPQDVADLHIEQNRNVELKPSGLKAACIRMVDLRDRPL